MERTEAALETLGIQGPEPREPRVDFQGAQAQLVGLAAVLAMRPAYLVLDEPTSRFDPHTAPRRW